MFWLKGRRLNFKVIRYHLRTIFLGPLVVGAAAMYFFAAIPQAREVYLGIIEDPSMVRGIFQGLFGLALIGLLCLLVDCWQHMLGTYAIDRMYPDHGDLYVDHSLLRLRNWIGRLSALLPVIGLGFGLFWMTIQASGAGKKFARALSVFGGKENFPEFKATLGALPNFTLKMTLTMVLVGAPAIAIVAFARSHKERTLLRNISLRRLAIWAGFALTVAAVTAPLMGKNYVVGAAQLAGPLAGAAIALIALVCLLMLLSYLSSIMRFPVMGTFMVGLLGWMVWQTTVALAPKPEDLAHADAVDNQRAHDLGPLTGTFDEWLKARRGYDFGAYEKAGLPYPVFIISAQGGGIYAAAASSAFLASMQDRCPNFAQHVFAVSGVSGGAVGSALFAAAAQEALVPSVGCKDIESEEGPLSARTRGVVRQDHLSPALALIWPDLARKLVPGNSDDTFDRSSVLERSFACAFDELKSWSLFCPPASGSGGTGLRLPFKDHWKLDRSAPALMLAGTWVETGFRTAFAPFPLHAVSDGTLDSFYQKDGKGDFTAQGIKIAPSRSLVEAAFVSARFPGIVPAWQQKASLINGADRLWNFVDGGYVDNSGATTAHELYKALSSHVQQGHAKDGKPEVKLYLVMLTDANTDPDLSKVEDGTRFSDIVAPITALLRVRDQLAYRAVTRAIDEAAPKAKAEDLAGRGRPSNVLAVNLKQDTFELPLGWKISLITDDIVRLMLGRPDLCDKSLPGTVRPGDVEHVIRDNSCVKKRIEALLSAKGDG